MSADLSAQRPGRARPVADAPVDQLVGQADELARRWAVSLLAARALPQMADVPLAQLAREAPALCAQLSRALRSDAELAQLLESPGARGHAGAERPAALWASIAAGGDASAAVHDVEALRSVVWAAVLGALSDPPTSQVADLADRLAFVCASVLAAMLAQRAPLTSTAGTPPPSGARRAEQVLYSSPPSAPSGRRAVLIDELAEADAADVGSSRARRGAGARREADTGGQPREGARGGAVSPAASSAQRTAPSQTTPRARPWDTPLNAAQPGVQSRGQEPASWPVVPEPQGASTVHVTRGPGAPLDVRVVDERA